MSCGNCFNFAKLNTESTEFNHAVHTPDKLDVAIFVPTGKIACAVCFLTVNGDKFFGGHLRTIQVTQPYACTQNYQFTGNATGYTTPIFVEHTHLISRNRLTNHGAVRVTFRYVTCGKYGTFGGAIGVSKSERQCTSRREFLAAARQPAQ